MAEVNTACKNIYRFIRLRLGNTISDREIARRWAMEWKSFNGLKHGKRQVPRIADLDRLAGVLGLDAAFVFEVARGVAAERVHALLEERDPEALGNLLMRNVYASLLADGAPRITDQAARRQDAPAAVEHRVIEHHLTSRFVAERQRVEDAVERQGAEAAHVEAHASPGT